MNTWAGMENSLKIAYISGTVRDIDLILLKSVSTHSNTYNSIIKSIGKNFEKNRKAPPLCFLFLVIFNNFQ